MTTPFSFYDDQYIDDMFFFISLNEEDDFSSRKIVMPTKYAKYTYGILATHNILERTTSFDVDYHNQIRNRTKNLYLPSTGLLMVNKKKPFRVKFKTT